MIITKKTGKYRRGFKDGWLELIGWLNGEVDVTDDLPDESKELFKRMLGVWLNEWKNSVKLK